jgi:hypothetical protein
MNRNPLGKFKKLLAFHAAMARNLANARKTGSIQTAASFKAALMTNAKVLRFKILFNKVGERIH